MDYGLQIDLLCALGGGLSLLFLADWGRSRFRVALVVLRTLAFTLLIVTVPVFDLRTLPLTLSFCVVLALQARPLEFGLAEVGAAAVAAVLWMLFPAGTPSRPPSGWEVVLFLMTATSGVACAVAVRWVAVQWDQSRRRIEALSEEVERLAHANRGFQQYASLLELESSRSERLRLSREIHDSAGYALTTLKMLFEAAKGLLVKDPDQLYPLMDQGAQISHQALQEIRYVLHELRRREDPLPTGMRLVALLVRNFEKACGVKVRLETSNAKGTYGPRIDGILARMVQEGLTNALHHGRATEVSILISDVDHALSVWIRDNGVGSQGGTKGIGLSGMEERVAEAGGWVHYQSMGRGFEVHATVPLREDS